MIRLTDTCNTYVLQHNRGVACQTYINSRVRLVEKPIATSAAPLAHAIAVRGSSPGQRFAWVKYAAPLAAACVLPVLQIFIAERL